jgi:hypothetical protein
MKEQSHKDEMSAALRGDFERLRERGVAVELAPQESGSEPEAPPEPEETERAEPMTNDEPPQDTAQETAPEPEPEPERRGWLSRLTGR